MSKICIIGGAGFIGSHLTYLLKDIHEITILDKNQSKIFPELTLLCDIRDPNRLNKLLKGIDVIIHLAAEHKDNISPVSLYYEVNVQGTRNILNSMDINNIKNLIFTSSVAIYGLNKQNATEYFPPDPFNHYGKSKWEAEEIQRNWYWENPAIRTLIIIRPTAIFGEGNRGNVYNLLKQIASNKFIMIGNGFNKKSIAYVGNVVAFLNFCIENLKAGYHVFNYADKPDLNMNEMVKQVELSLEKKIFPVHLPYWLGYLGGISFDIISKITGKEYSVSAVRVKKFCATTQFNASAAKSTGFVTPFTLQEALHRTLQYEFLFPDNKRIVFA